VVEDIMADQLMQLAVNKFDLLAQRDAAPVDNEKIIAMKTNVPARAPGQQANARRAPREARRNPQDYAWKKVPPTASEGTSKVVDDKTYNWCSRHKAWCIHTSKDCNLNPAKQARPPM
jgi:hypothetical protein